MKKLLVLFITITCNVITAQVPELVGEWNTGKSHGIIVGLTMDENGFFSLSNAAVPGVGNQKSGDYMISMKYEVDTTKSPYRINFIIFDEGKEEELLRWKGVYRMLDENKLLLRVDFMGNGFIQFSKDPDDAYTFLLHRKPIEEECI